MHAPLTRKTKILGAALAVAALFVGAVAWRKGAHVPSGAATGDMSPIAAMTQTSSGSNTLRAPLAAPPRGPSPSPAAPPETVSVEDLLKHGSTQPLTPPEIRVDTELAPGSVATAEPLTPPVVSAGPVELAPGSVATAEPLTPPVVEVPAAPATR
jgi:hypothetical protein